MPLYTAIQPAWRPITSTTITRLWDSAVVCRRSIASVAICTAVWKPNVKSVPARSLSIVFGTPDHVDAVLAQPARHAERVLAADGDQAVDAVRLERGGDPLGAPVLLEGVGARGAEDRAAAVQEPARVVEVERRGCRRAITPAQPLRKPSTSRLPCAPGAPRRGSRR